MEVPGPGKYDYYVASDKSETGSAVFLQRGKNLTDQFNDYPGIGYYNIETSSFVKP